MIKKYIPPIVTTFVGIFACIYRILHYEIHLPDLLIMLSYFPLIWMVHFIKAFHISFVLEIVYDIFLILSISFGSIMKFYDQISWWDILCHTYWGYIGCYFGVILLCKFKYHQMTFFLFIALCFLISMACASIWECFEFTCDRIFSLNVQHWQDTGVYDTMYDILCNFGGALLFTIHFWIDHLFFHGTVIEKIKKELLPLSLKEE